MGVSIRIRQTRRLNGDCEDEWTLRLVSKRTSARVLIRQHVERELSRSRVPATASRALVEPTTVERRLNGVRRIEARSPIERAARPDPEAEIDAAVAAFETNGFVMLVDDAQVESLDDTFGVTDDTVVTFLRLVPIVGG